MKKLSAKDEQDIYNKRINKCISAAELAHEYGVTRQAIYAIERHSIFLLVGEEDQMENRLFRREIAYKRAKGRAQRLGKCLEAIKFTNSQFEANHSTQLVAGGCLMDPEEETVSEFKDIPDDKLVEYTLSKITAWNTSIAQDPSFFERTKRYIHECSSRCLKLGICGYISKKQPYTICSTTPREGERCGKHKD